MRRGGGKKVRFRNPTRLANSAADGSTIVVKGGAAAINRYRLAEQVAMTRVTGSAPTTLGQYRSYLRNANALTYTETNGTPGTTPTAADGFYFYGSPNGYDTADASGHPTLYEIFVGTRKKVTFEWYQSAGRTGVVFTQPKLAGALDNTRGVVTHYDPTTGIVTVTLPVNSAATANMYSGYSPSSASILDVYFDIVIEPLP